MLVLTDCSFWLFVFGLETAAVIVTAGDDGFEDEWSALLPFWQVEILQLLQYNHLCSFRSEQFRSWEIIVPRRWTDSRVSTGEWTRMMGGPRGQHSSWGFVSFSSQSHLHLRWTYRVGSSATAASLVCRGATVDVQWEEWGLESVLTLCLLSERNTPPVGPETFDWTSWARLATGLEWLILEKVGSQATSNPDGEVQSCSNLLALKGN